MSKPVDPNRVINLARYQHVMLMIEGAKALAGECWLPEQPMKERIEEIKEYEHKMPVEGSTLLAFAVFLDDIRNLSEKRGGETWYINTMRGLMHLLQCNQSEVYMVLEALAKTKKEFKKPGEKK
jgi:hypothetical protein